MRFTALNESEYAKVGGRNGAAAAHASKKLPESDDLATQQVARGNATVDRFEGTACTDLAERAQPDTISTGVSQAKLACTALRQFVCMCIASTLAVNWRASSVRCEAQHTRRYTRESTSDLHSLTRVV